MFRFAPSPTGDMHIGNLRVALFNYILSKKMGERFLIRIEDTDKERNIEGKDREILEILRLFGITYDELFYQSANLPLHQKKAQELIDNGLAFRCYCTEDELDAKREEAIKKGEPYRYDGACEHKGVCDAPFTVRIKKPVTTISFRDEIKGEFNFEPKDVDSFVILRKDMTPTYNFACAVDDCEFGITHIIRGEDHVSNTPKQIHIRRSLGYKDDVKFAHLPILLNDENKKMSKRDSASGVAWLISQDIMPTAIANYLLLLGNKTPKEIFSITEAMEFLDLSHVSKSPARFDLDKLMFVNREHLRHLPRDEIAKSIGLVGMNALLDIYLNESQTLSELKEKIAPIFAPKTAPSEFKAEFETIKSTLLDMELPTTYDELKSALTQSTGLKGKNLFKPLRVLFSGKEDGPELALLYLAIKDRLKDIVNA